MIAYLEDGHREIRYRPQLVTRPPTYAISSTMLRAIGPRRDVVSRTVPARDLLAFKERAGRRGRE
jgi:hypothetical protein